MKRIIIAGGLLLALAACQTAGPKPDAWCLTNSAHRPSAAEIAAMTDARVRQVLAHNKLGAKRCGWRAR